MSKLDQIFKEAKPTAEELGQFKEVKKQIKALFSEIVNSSFPVTMPSNLSSREHELAERVAKVYRKKIYEEVQAL